MKFAICIGHSRKIDGRFDGGAVGTNGKSEREFWLPLGNVILDRLKEHGHRGIVWNQYQGIGYGSSMRWLSGQIRAEKCDAAIELHFNSSDNPSANGHECLYWWSSQKGRRLATSINNALDSSSITTKNRGIHAITAGGRGDGFLRKTHCPACIVEPFFGSNVTDMESAWMHRVRLAYAIADGCAGFE